MTAAVPSKIELHRRSKRLDVQYADGRSYQFPAEYLRVWSPSAEVRGHGGGEPTLVAGKQAVNISAVEPVGNYAVRLRFDDGHATGLFSWDVFADLGENQAKYWAQYLTRLDSAGLQRQAAAPGSVKQYGLREARLKGEA